MINKFYILVSVVLLSGCASSPMLDFEALESTHDKPAYVIFNLGKKSRYIKHLVFRHTESEINYAFNIDRREGEVVVLLVPPGNYFLAGLKTHMLDKQAMRFKKPEQLLSFSEGKAYYLGDLSWQNESVVVEFSKEPVVEALTAKKGIAENTELFVYNHLFGDPSIASVSPRNKPSLGASESFNQIPCNMTGARNISCTN